MAYYSPAIAGLIPLSWMIQAQAVVANPLQTTSQLGSSALSITPVEKVSRFLEGIMDTSAQAATNPKAPNVRMITCRIQVVDTDNSQDSIFLYQEQALIDQLSRPYRQRFLHIKSGSTDRTVESLTYKPEKTEAWIGLCKRSPTQRIVKFTELGSPICSVFLQSLGIRFVGVTPREGCPANVRGAVRITNQVELFPSGMNTWDRGFDANGKQVWGAKSESYQYRRSKS